eukprot:scaffold5771_cov171-Amphora_coffeaeformis.AAC.19
MAQHMVRSLQTTFSTHIIVQYLGADVQKTLDDVKGKDISHCGDGGLVANDQEGHFASENACGSYYETQAATTTTVHAIGVRGSQGSSYEGRVLRPFEESCTAVVAVMDYGDNKPDKKFLECETPAGTTFRVPVSEDWIHEKMASGELESGRTKLDVTGATFDKTTRELVLPSGPPGLVNKPNRERKLVSVVGEKTVLVVRVIAADSQTTSSEDHLSDSVFGTFGDPVNLKTQYAACSADKLNFVPAAPRNSVNGKGNIVNGVTTVTVSSSSSDGDGVMNSDIAKALNAQFGVSTPSNLADHVMYCLPPNTMNGIAYAWVNSWNSVYSDNWCTYVSGQMHELGHNINLAHSNEGADEYADQSGFMGYSYSQDDQKMCFNGAKLWQLGWFSDKQSEIPIFGGSFLLDGFTKYGSSNNNVVLKIVGNDGDYYAVFNWKTAHNSQTVEAGNQVTVVKRESGTGYALSYLMAKLNAGSSFVIPAADPYTMTVNSIDTINGVASVTFTTSAAPECTMNADCDDSDPCNGAEICSAGICVPGTHLTCPDDGLFCNGPETCVTGVGCQSGPAPACIHGCDEGTDQCNACSSNADCDDSDPCNGVETCSAGTCIPGTPLTCSDDGLFCNGPETCVAGVGCRSGPAPECTNGCDEANDRCFACSTDSQCSNGNLCDGMELCSAGYCQGGTAVACSSKCGALQVCNPSTGVCEGDGDGFCDVTGGETCDVCASDCTATFVEGETNCGNGICEDGEDCYNCPGDCAGVTSGKPSGRFCCAGGPSVGSSFVSCTDSRCGGSAKCSFSEMQPIVKTSCCGDSVCEGDETSVSCPSDCLDVASPTSTPPTSTPPTVAPPTTPTPQCLLSGDSCSDGSQCCSGNCIGKGGGTCK